MDSSGNLQTGNPELPALQWHLKFWITWWHRSHPNGWPRCLRWSPVFPFPSPRLLRKGDVERVSVKQQEWTSASEVTSVASSTFSWITSSCPRCDLLFVPFLHVFQGIQNVWQMILSWVYEEGFCILFAGHVPAHHISHLSFRKWRYHCDFSNWSE